MITDNILNIDSYTNEFFESWFLNQLSNRFYNVLV